MPSLNPDQIYRRTQDSLNTLALKLTNFIGHPIDSTIQREIGFFGLQEEAKDGVLSQEELQPVIDRINSLDLHQLTNQGYIKYNRGQNSFSLNTSRYQTDIARTGNPSDLIKNLNGDGEINIRDIQALNYILNQTKKNEISLEDQLAGLNDPSFLIRKELEFAAQRRGLTVVPERNTAFIEKFISYVTDKNLI